MNYRNELAVTSDFKRMAKRRMELERRIEERKKRMQDIYDRK